MIEALILVILFSLYFLPTFLAYKRNHNNLLAISVLNFFTGFTFIGWIGSLVWSLTNNKGVK